MPDPNAKDRAWPLFDAIVQNATLKDVNPWDGAGSYAPDFETLCSLLAVPRHLKAEVRSGVPALALDVWVAYELRRAGLERDWVWPRAEPPRVVSRDLLRFIDAVPAAMRAALLARVRSGKSNNQTTSASANLLGNHYVKQVDVVMSAWETGPELLISTKRMDSSFGNNAFNRIEESYGDAKNLRIRHPSAAVGFVYALRSTAWDKKAKEGEAGIAERIVDLIGKLQREPDAYHACCVLAPEYEGEAPKEVAGASGSEEAEEESDLLPLDPEPGGTGEEYVAEVESQVDVEAELAALPTVTLRHDLVPDEVSAARFFKVIMETVLANSPISYHRRARRLRG